MQFIKEYFFGDDDNFTTSANQVKSVQNYLVLNYAAFGPCIYLSIYMRVHVESECRSYNSSEPTIVVLKTDGVRDLTRANPRDCMTPVRCCGTCLCDVGSIVYVCNVQCAYKLHAHAPTAYQCVHLWLTRDCASS